MARPRKFSEEQVLRAVRDQFWDAGYAGTSLDDLMRVTGLGKGSIYGAFGDKHEIFLTVLGTYAKNLEAALLARLDGASHPLEALTAFVLAPVDEAAGKAARRGCLMANSVSELGSVDEDVVAAAQRMYASVVGALATYVRRAQAKGDISGDVDADSFALTLLTIQQGITFMARAGTDTTALTATAKALTMQLLPGRD